jgi:hypothetical protein
MSTPNSPLVPMPEGILISLFVKTFRLNFAYQPWQQEFAEVTATRKEKAFVSIQSGNYSADSTSPFPSADIVEQLFHFITVKLSRGDRVEIDDVGPIPGFAQPGDKIFVEFRTGRYDPNKIEVRIAMRRTNPLAA